MWPKIKKWLWRLFILGMIVGVLILGALTFFWFSLQKPSYQEYYAAKIIEQLPEPWKSNAKCGKIGGRLPGSFLLQDLKVSTPNGDQITLHNITLSWDWLELLHRKIVIHTIEIEKLSLLLKQTTDKKWLPDLTSEPTPPPVEKESQNDAPLTIPEIAFKLQTLSLNDIDLQLLAQETSWQSLRFQLKNLNINAELENEASILTAALSLNSSMELNLDEYPDVFLNTSLTVQHRDDTIEIKLDKIKVSTAHSHISIQSEAQLKKFNLQDITVNNILKNLNLTFDISNAKISQQDISSLLDQFELPDDVALNGAIQFQQQNLNTQWNIQCEKQKLSLTAQIDQLQIDKPLHNQLKAKLDLKCSPHSFVPDLSGEAVTSLNFNGNLAELKSWKIQQDLIATLSYKNLKLPEIKHQMTLEKQAVKLQQTISDASIQLQHQLNTSLNSFSNLQSIDPLALSFSNELDLNVPDIKQLTGKWQNILQLKQKLRGSHHLNLKLDGNSDELSYQLTSQNKKLYIDQALPNSISLEFSGKAIPKNFLDPKNIPTFPELTFTQDSLQQDVRDLGQYLNTWVELLELPNLNIKASGNELHPLVEKLDLSLTQMSPKQYQLSLFSETDGMASLIDLQTDLLFSKDAWIFELSKLKLNSQLADEWNHSWLEQALVLNQPSTLTANWNQSELSWSPLLLGKDHWLSTEGIIRANGDLDAAFKLQTPELKSWLSSLPPLLPLILHGKIFLDGNLSGSWFRPLCKIELQSKDLKLEKEQLPTIAIDHLHTKFILDSRKKKNLEVNLLLKPENEKGFQGKLLQQLTYNEGVWLPTLEQKGSFDIGTLEGTSMSLNLAEYFLPKNINQLKGKWGLSVNGTLPLLQPEKLDFSGNFYLSGFSANIQEAPNVFKEADLEISLKPNHVEITKFKVHQSKGHISLSGNAFSDNLMAWHNPHWNIQLQMQQWQTKALDFASLQSESKINMHGNLHQHHIQGFIEINDFNLKPNKLPLSSSLAARDPNIEMVNKIQTWEEYDTEIETKQEKVPNALKNAHIQLEVRLNHNNWIRDDLFQGELVGKLLVQKEFKQESLHPVGTISLQKAVLKFQSNRFTMEKGDLNWQGDLIPAINFTFITKVDPYEIKLLLREDLADQVKPEFSSQPWLDNSDIISVLLMGRPLHSESENSGNDSFAQDLAVSQGVSQLSKEMGLGNMGIDIDNVSSKGGTVRIGRYLHPRVYVAIAKTIGVEESNELSLEYLILKNLKFKVTQETQVPLGFDLEWTKDY
jgi:autotransporter translocation and assembly factor TamB